MTQLIFPEPPSPDPIAKAGLAGMMRPTSDAARRGLYEYEVLNNFTTIGLRTARHLTELAEGEKIAPEVLNKEFDQKVVTFDTSLTRMQANAIYNRKLERIARDDLWERSGSMFTASGFNAVLGMLGGQLTDPVGMGLGFLIQPTRLFQLQVGTKVLAAQVGVLEAKHLLATTAGKELAYGLGAQQLGGAFARAASEDLLKRATGVFVLSAADNVVAQIALEPFMHLMESQLYGDYTALDSLVNVTIGGVLGGGVGSAAVFGARGISRGLHYTQEWMPSWLAGKKSVTHDTAFAKAINDMMNGEQPDVDAIIRSDPQTTARKELFESAKILESEKFARVASQQAEIDATIRQVEESKIKTEEEKIAANERAQKLVLDSPVVVHFKGGKVSVEDSLGDVKEVDVRLNKAVGKYASEEWSELISQKNVVDSWRYSVPDTEYHAVLVDKNGRVLIAHDMVDGFPSPFLGVKNLPMGKNPTFEVLTHLQKKGLLVKGEVLSKAGSKNQRFSFFELDLDRSVIPDGFSLFSMADPDKIEIEIGTNNKWKDPALPKLIRDFLAEKPAFKSLNEIVPENENLFKIPEEVKSNIFGPDMDPWKYSGTPLDLQVIHEENLTKIGGSAGSNEGGFYTDVEGTQYYVKTPQTQEHAETEIAAHLLYRMAYPQNTPEVAMVRLTNGGIGLGSKLLPEVKSISPKELSSLATEVTPIMATTTSGKEVQIQVSARQMTVDFLDNYTFDAWLANRDVFGQFPNFNVHYRAVISDELLATQKAAFSPGEAGFEFSLFKLDFGGSMDWRAHNGKKSSLDFSTQVNEKAFLNEGGKKWVFEVLSKAKQDGILDGEIGEAGVYNALSLTEENIYKAMEASGASTERVKKLTGLLVERQKALSEAFHEVAYLVDSGLGKTNFFDKNDAWGHLIEKAQEVSKSYPLEIKKAISEYTLSSVFVNKKLWSGQITKKSGETIKLLDEAMANPVSELGINTTLKRTEEKLWWGLKSYQDLTLLIGHAYNFKGFMSTSLYKSVYEDGLGIVWEIKAPANTKGVYVAAGQLKTPKTSIDLEFANEFEFLVDRGSMLAIKNVVMTTEGNWKIHAELVQPHMVNGNVPLSDVPKLLAKYKEPGGSGAISDVRFQEKIASPLESFLGDSWGKQIDVVVNDLYAAQRVPEIPELVERVESKLALHTKNEIAQLETSFKSEDPEFFATNKADLEFFDAQIKKSDDVTKAIKQAWTCYKGM